MNNDRDEVLQGMKAMKAVVDNRLRHQLPENFGAPGATDYADIITAPNQWAGFSQDDNGNVQIANTVLNRINQVLRIANTGAARVLTSSFVQDVLDVATKPVVDQFASLTKIGDIAVAGGAYGFRTEGSNDPGGSQIAVPEPQGGIIAGNQFYTLRA